MIFKIKVRKFGSSAGLPIQDLETIDFLSNLMICHVPSKAGDMKMKAIYLGLMVRRLFFWIKFSCLLLRIFFIFSCFFFLVRMLFFWVSWHVLFFITTNYTFFYSFFDLNCKESSVISFQINSSRDGTYWMWWSWFLW